MNPYRILVRCAGRPSNYRPGAFTLVELLVVIAIIAILAGLLLPVLSTTQSKAKGIYCLNNHKELTLAWKMYCDDYHDHVPPNPRNSNIDSTWVTNCAKSFVTREGVERVVKGYVVPKVGLPWPEWIKT